MEHSGLSVRKRNAWGPGVTWGALALLCVTLAAATAGIARLRQVQRAADYFGRSWHVVRDAEDVEVYRLSYRAGEVWSRGSQPPADRFRVGPAIVPSPGWTRRLRETLQDPDQYEWMAAKACIPQPGVAVRFSQGTERADLLLCFSCKMLSI
ncbi:MAG TPA: hypothetical protein VK689_16735, partial [Armatimonadota bacterium]|nr:hypothetical protein [Armatimonadota bacterium]